MCDSKTTFWKFLEHKIEIPIIQRDYAQGRIGNERLRKRFLTEIKKALDENDFFSLDFIYGIKEKDTFIPLDGQQRLTTLWLLYWYIAFKTKKLKVTEVFETLNNFTYETRVSSREFCNKLTNLTFIEHLYDSYFELEDSRKIVKTIENQTWFLKSWKQDPTIQAMLNMLGGTPIKDNKENEIIDGIEEIFDENCNFEKYWKTLTEGETLTFYYLDLKDNNLSDDLYIKMNARGKPLTDFENFKADFIGIIEQNEWEKENKEPQETISYKLDTIWTDIFWKFKSRESNIDEIYFAFFNRFLLGNLITAKNSKKDYLFTADKLEKENKLFQYLYGNKSAKYSGIDIYDFNNLELYQQDFLKRLSNVFDNFYYSFKDLTKEDINKLFYPSWDNKSNFRFIPEYFEENEISNLTQKQRIVFFAICKYFEKGKYDKIKLKHWMRVVWNIVENAGIDTISAMIGAFRLIDVLGEYSHRIYEYLKERDFSNFFAQEQVTEEKLKASLILKDNLWEDIFIKYEANKYFKGQIGFLFKFVTCNNEEGRIQDCYNDCNKEIFIDYSEKLHRIFNNKTDDDTLFERTLLSIDNYLLQSFSNLSFGLLEKTGKYIKRWKDHFFKDDRTIIIIKKLLDKIEAGKEKEGMNKVCQEFIDNPGSDLWRKLFVQIPETITYCRQRLIRWNDKRNILLLGGSATNHYHAELYSYAFYHYLRKDKSFNYKPFEKIWYYFVRSVTETPCAVMDEWQYGEHNFAIDISFNSGKFKFKFFDRKNIEINDEHLIEVLEMNAFQKKENGYWRETIIIDFNYVKNELLIIFSNLQNIIQ